MTKDGIRKELPALFRDWLIHTAQYGDVEDVRRILDEIDSVYAQVDLPEELQPVQEGWAYACRKDSERQAELRAKETPDQYGNKPSDYTRTGSSTDSYHAQSIGWKHPDFD